MEDKDLQQLFRNFNPEISSSDAFMSNLKRGMDVIEMLRAQNLALKKRNRKAIAIAAACGFVMGVIMTLLFPYVSGWMATLSITLPLSPSLPTISTDVLIWFFMAAVCIITTLNIYEIALAKLKTDYTGQSAL